MNKELYQLYKHLEYQLNSCMAGELPYQLREQLFDQSIRELGLVIREELKSE